MFFELRQYRTLPGQRERWVRFMEETIIPFQISKGMVVVSFAGDEEDDLYIWIRRFDSEQRVDYTPRSTSQTTGKMRSHRKSARCSTAAALSWRASRPRPNPSFASTP